MISEAHGPADPLARLQRYIAVVAKLRPGREVAIRAWAGKDKRVRELLQRVDGLRLEFARESARALLSPCARSTDVEALAQLAFLALIGLVHTADQGDGRIHQLFAYLTDLGTRSRNDVCAAHKDRPRHDDTTEPAASDQALSDAAHAGSSRINC